MSSNGNNGNQPNGGDVNMTADADQASKRQRTGENAAAAPSSSSSSSSSDTQMRDVNESKSNESSAPAAAASSSTHVQPTPAQLAEMRINMQRYVKQVTTGCGRPDCTNRECVSGGATPVVGNAAILNKAKQLYAAKLPSCVSAAQVGAPQAQSNATPVTASTSLSSSSSSSSSLSAPPPQTVRSTPLVQFSAAPPRTPATPQTLAPSSASASAFASPAPASVATPMVTMRTPAQPIRPTSALLGAPARSRSGSNPPPLPSSAVAAASSSSSLAAPSSSSSSSSPQPGPRASPSLTEMLSLSSPILPVTSIEPPILSVSEWIQQLNAAKAVWEEKGSPANDISMFRPMITRIYKVFNELNCLNRSFRVKKDENERADTKKEDDAMTDVPATTTTTTSTSSTAAASSSAASSSSASASSEYIEPTQYSPAINYEELDAFYESVSSIVIPQSDGSEVRPILNSLINGLRNLLTELCFRPITQNQIHPALMRALPIIYENSALFFDPSHYELLKLLCKFMSVLPSTVKKLVSSWMSDVEKWTPTPVVHTAAQRARMYSLDRLERLLGAIQQYIAVRIFDKEDLRDVAPAVVFISIIHDTNEGFADFYRSIPISVPKVARHPVPIDYKLFYSDAVNETVDLKQDFRRYLQQLHQGTAGTSIDFSFFRYNFILDAGSKANLLKYDSQMQQHLQYRDSLVANGMDQRAGYLILEVRRSNLIADTLRSLANKPQEAYKKPLKIHFQGEKGIDAGGLRKEFFQLIIAELFDARFGMFLVDEESRTFRFNPDSLDSPLEFELIGVLFGLAIYNSTILDMRLPQVYYKQLLGGKPNIDDLLQMSPSLAKGLIQLLEFDGDVESTFARDFTISYESYGEQKVVELKPDGANIPVTNANRHEFVDLYVSYLLEKSIAKQFQAFNKGFHLVCGGEALKLFRPFELELLVCGIGELDFEALESSTRYDDGYTADSPIIKQFWEIVHNDLTLDEKKRLLEFATGSDRVPIRGLASMQLTISKQGPDSDQLPTSHTCFNHLLIPQYESKEKLKRLLILALQNSKGFGLI